MSGFLARLAARAGGDQPAAVRPRHRSLFEPGRAALDEPAPLVRTSPLRVAPPEPSLQAGRTAAPAPPPRVVSPTTKDDEPSARPGPAIAKIPPVASSSVRETSATAPLLPPGELATERKRKLDDELLPSRPIDPPLIPATTPQEDRAPAAPNPRPEPVAPRLQQERESPRTAAHEPRPAPTMRAHEPPLTRRSTVRLDAHREQEPPIVHVTIGRVEVRAAPGQKGEDAGETRKRPAVTTLDAYLKQRAEARR